MSVIDFRPHKLFARVLKDAEYDEFGGQLSEQDEYWEEIAPCFCHDSSQTERVFPIGEQQSYQYHIAYNGRSIPIGTKVCCKDASGDVVGEGEVKRTSANYCEAFSGRHELWI